MPGLYKDEGIVLRSIKLGEADRIVTLFTRANGKVRAVAKGVRKTKSRFGGRLEPFTLSSFLIYKGKKDLDTVTGVDVLTSFRAVRSDYDRYVAASAISEVVEKILPDREPSHSTYTLLLGGIEALAAGRVDNVVPAFLVKLLSVSGYHPHLQVCAGCGTTEGLIAFSPGAGGVICAMCRREHSGAVLLPADRLALMTKLLSADFGYVSDPGASNEVTAILRRYAEWHIERPLKSLDLLPAV